MPQAPRKERPKEWSLDKAKKDGAKVRDFDYGPPQFPMPKDRSKDGKFQSTPKGGKK